MVEASVKSMVNLNFTPFFYKNEWSFGKKYEKLKYSLIKKVRKNL